MEQGNKIQEEERNNFRVEFMQYYYYTKQAQMDAYNLPPLLLKIKQSILKIKRKC